MRTAAAKYWAAVFVVSALSLWIRSAFPVNVVGHSTHDDLLFIQLANHIYAGDWLGPYDRLTLAKGMFYSIFIACAHYLHLPLKLAEHGVYLAAAIAVAEFVRRKTRNFALAAIVFAALAFNPLSFSAVLARVLREGLYTSLSLWVAVLFFCVVFPLQVRTRSGLWQMAVAVGLGAAGAAYWLTREEGVWLAPALLVTSLFSAARLWWQYRNTPFGERGAFRRSVTKEIAVPLCVAVAVFVGLDLLVAGVNYRKYGIFETNEFRSKSFLHAYGALARVRPDHWQPYIVFPREVRERVYAVSPAARELILGFEGPGAQGWRNSGCAAIAMKPCTEVPSGWVMWEFRDAVTVARHYGSGREAKNFYDKLAAEIDAACDQKKLDCLPRRDAIFPALRSEYLKPTAAAVLSLSRDTLTLRGNGIGNVPVSGGPEEIAQFTKIVDDVSHGVPSGQQKYAVNGWIAYPADMPKLRVVTPDDKDENVTINTAPAPDVQAAFPGMKAVRFATNGVCEQQSCLFVVEAPGQPQAKSRLAAMYDGEYVDFPMAKLRIERTMTEEPELPRDESHSARFRVAVALSSIHSVALPAFAVLGAIGFVYACLLWRAAGVPVELFALGAACLTAVATRIVLLSYITATSFPAANLLYMAPGMPFVILFAVVGTYCGWAAGRRWWMERRERTEKSADQAMGVAG